MDQEMELQTLSGDDAADVSPPSKKGGFSPRSLLRTTRRKGLLIAGITGILSTAAWLATAGDLPIYRGGFQLLVEPVTSEARISEPTSLTRSEGGVPSRDFFGLDYPTQLEILRSPKVLEAVYSDVQSKYPAFGYIDLITGLTVQRLGETRTTETKLLQITYQANDPVLVQLVLNQLAEKYLNYSLDDRKTRISEGVKFIEDQLPSLQQRVDELQGQVQEIQQSYELIDPASQGTQIAVQSQQLAEQQRATEQMLQEQKILYANLQKQLQLSPDQAIAASALSQDPRYQQLMGGLNELESQIALESARFSEASPIIQRLRQKQTNLDGLMQQQAQQILGPRLAQSAQTLTYQDPLRLGLIKQLIDTANQIQILQVRGQLVNRSRADVEEQMRQFPAIARRYGELQRQLGLAIRTLDQLLGQRETLRVEAAQTQLPWELVSPPLLPRDETGAPVPDPVTSRKKLIAGVLGGLLLGVGTAILIEKRQDIFFEPSDVVDLVPAPLLGSIPIYRNANPCRELLAFNVGNASDLHTQSAIAFSQPQPATELNADAFPFLDAFTTLFASLNFLPARTDVRSLVVCSPLAGDGKTTMALHLARTAAAAGQRVLLVDANFRAPQLHDYLNVSNQKGLSDLLQQAVSLADAIQPCPGINHLFVLTAGQTPPGSTQLLASPRMKETMSKLTADYDLVIYDTPALYGAVDANFLAAQADGLVMVVSVQQTSYAKTSQVLKQLDEFHLPLLGVVVNRFAAKGYSSLEDDEEEDEDGVWERASAQVGEYNGDGYRGDEYPQAPIPTPTFAEDIAS